MALQSFTGYRNWSLFGRNINVGDQFSLAGKTQYDILLSDDDVNAEATDASGTQLAYSADNAGTVLIDGIEFTLKSSFTFTAGGVEYVGYHFATTGNSPVNFSILPDFPATATATVTSVNTSPGSVDYASLASGDEVVDASTFTSLDLSGDDSIITGDGNDVVGGGASNDTIDAGSGDDVIFGASGNDIISGGDGDDIIRGDATTEGADFSTIPDPDNGGTIDNGDNLLGGATPASDTIQLSLSFDSTANTQEVSYLDTTPQYTEGLNNGLETTNNAIQLTGNGTGDTTTAHLDFTSVDPAVSNEVENVNFRLNDIDSGTWQDTITVQAFDAAGNPVEVILTGGANMTLTDEDGVSGFDTATANAGSGNQSPSDAVSSLLVEIPGPVAKIVFTYGNEGSNFQLIDMTEVFFDTIPTDLPSSGSFDDTIDGGAGNDVIYGNLGDDDIVGGTGADTIFGGDGVDTIDGGADDDVIDGGEGSDVIAGGDGADEIRISSDNDVIDGGAGADTYTAFGETSLADQTITVVVNNEGDSTVTKHDDGAIDTVDTVTSVETYIADEAAAESDQISLTAAGLRTSDVSGIDDTAAGIFTPKDGSAPISFGGVGEPTFSELMSGTYSPSPDVILNGSGDYVISGGDESGQVGNTAFENFENIEFSIVCFADGTLIKTDNGQCEVEALKVGDLVETLDKGMQPIRWIGSKTLNKAILSAKPNLRPIRIKAGALGENLPFCDLLVSPQHRILVKSKIAIRMFDAEEVFVPAKHLLKLDGVEVADDVPAVTYYHVMCDNHEIIQANGAPAESLHTGTEAMKAISRDAIEEITQIFGDQPYLDRPTARLTPKGKLAKKLVERHAQNHQFLYSCAL